MPTSRQSEARAKVSMDSASFEKGAKKIIEAANAMSSAVNTAFAAVGVAMLAAFGANTVSAVIDSAKEILTLGEQMANAGKKAGLAAGQFYLFHNSIEKGLSLKTVAKLIGENADALNRSANVFRDVSLKLWVVGEKVRGFWLGLMERVAPVLSRILDGALGASLVQAGQWFGEKIADAVAIVYQLAEDGKLWEAFKKGFQLAFDYAGERLFWLGNVGYEVLRAMFSKSFVDGIGDALASVWSSFSSFTEGIGKLIGDAFWNMWTWIKNDIYATLNQIDRILNAVGIVSDETMNRNADDRASDVRNSRAGGEQKQFEPKTEVSFADAVKDIFAKNQFNPSERLTNEIDGFSRVIGESLTKYKAQEKTNPPTTLENNSRQKVFGADSLAGIGAGGNVYLGLSVLDVNRAQLAELRDINRKLSGQSVTNRTNVNVSAPPVSITRVQTSSSVN